MGINVEFMKLVFDLRLNIPEIGNSVVEIGAQDVCAAKEVIRQVYFDHVQGRSEQSDGSNIFGKEKYYAEDIYALAGFNHYVCIDACGNNNAIVYDLNNDLNSYYSFQETFDLVTNLGTSEHVFNQFSVFKNLHDLCKIGGVMIHALPMQGNVNHGFFNYHPRFIADLAAANNYEILKLAFTVDYKSQLIEYTQDAFKKWDSHDVLFYAVLRKLSDSEFNIPFDGMFASINRLKGYSDIALDPMVTEFAPYLKTGCWENTKGVVADNLPCHKNNFVQSLFSRLFFK